MAESPAVPPHARPQPLFVSKSTGRRRAESRWAWVVALAASGVYGIAASTITCSGIIFLELVEHVGSSHQVTLWAFNTGGLVALLSGPFVGYLTARTSHRSVMAMGVFFLSLGIVTSGLVLTVELLFLSWSVYGFGLGCLLLTSFTCTSDYFRHHHGLSVGIVSCGGGVMSLVMPLILRKLLDEYSFGSAMTMFAGVTLHAFPLVALVRPRKLTEPRRNSLPMSSCGSCRDTEKTKMADDAFGCSADPPASADRRPSTAAPTRELCDSDADAPSFHRPEKLLNVEDALDILSLGTLLRHHGTWILAVTAMCLELGMSVIYTVIVAYGEEAQVEKDVIADLLSVSGAVQIVSVAVHGFASDRRLTSAVAHVALCCGATGLAVMLSPLVSDATWSVGIALVGVGSAGAAAYSLMPVVIVEIFDRRALEAATGMQMASQSVGLVISTLATGAIYEGTKSWRPVLYYVGVALAAASVTFGIYHLLRRKRTQ